MVPLFAFAGITNLDKRVGNLKNLEVLYLGGNELTEVWQLCRSVCPRHAYIPAPCCPCDRVTVQHAPCGLLHWVLTRNIC